MYGEINEEERRPLFAVYAPRIRGFCRLCGGSIRENEIGLRYGDTLICADCVSDVSIRQLLRICEFNSRRELLETIGFTEF